MKFIITKKDTSRIDEIALEEYGFQSGAVEALLDGNVGLAAIALNIPYGTRIFCPEISKPVNRSLRLWD